jgi:hypothetical protein
MAHRNWLLPPSLLLLGCAQLALSGGGSGVITEAEAIVIARGAVSSNDTWVDRATFEAKRDAVGWTVIVWREPRGPGDHRFVFISAQGKVTAYVRGL